MQLALRPKLILRALQVSVLRAVKCKLCQSRGFAVQPHNREVLCVWGFRTFQEPLQAARGRLEGYLFCCQRYTMPATWNGLICHQRSRLLLRQACRRRHCAMQHKHWSTILAPLDISLHAARLTYVLHTCAAPHRPLHYSCCHATKRIHGAVCRASHGCFTGI